MLFNLRYIMLVIGIIMSAISLVCLLYSLSDDLFTNLDLLNLTEFSGCITNVDTTRIENQKANQVKV